MSTHKAANQFRLVIGNVLGTTLPANGILPSFVAELAASAITVEADSLHFIYVKMSKYLLKDPEFKLFKMLSYWLDKVLDQPPTEDDVHYREVEWLLDILITGLCRPAVSEIC